MFKSQIINKILIGILIPLFLALLFGYIRASQNLSEFLDYTNSEMTNTMGQIEREFQLVLEASRQLSETMAVNAALLDALEERESDYLFQWGRRLVRSGLVSRVTFVGADGIILARGHDEHRFNDDLRKSSLYGGLKIEKPFAGLAENGSEWLLTTVTPVFRFDVLHRGTIITEKAVSDSFLEELEKNYNVDRIQIRMDGFGDDIPVEPSRGDQIQTLPLNIPCLKGQSCSLTVVKNMTPATRLFRKLQSELTAFVIVVFLAAAVFIYMAITRALRPIREVHDHLQGFQLQRFSFDQLLQRLKKLHQDKTEMGVIAASVSKTLLQLKRSQSELKQANEQAIRAQAETQKANEELRRIHLHLEEMVKERTAELLARTEQLKSEIDERNRAEQRYRTLVENATDAIFILQRGLIRFPNPKTLEMFGFSDSELINTRFLELVAAEDRPLFYESSTVPLSDEKVCGTHSFSMVSRSKQVIRVQMNSVPTVWEGSPGLLCFIRDVTEYRRTQEILIQSEKMLSIGGLAAGMAHEINNPLAGMMQSAQMVLNRLLHDHPENEKAAAEAGITMTAIRRYNSLRKIDRFLSNINRAGEQAARIVDNMLSFARKSETVREETALNELIEKTLELARNDYDLKKEYDFKRISVIKEFDPHLPTVMCETSKIQQVIFNIIRNAAEAMSEHGSPDHGDLLIIRTRLFNGKAQIEIEDNGPGMEESVRKRVFEPFYTTKSVDKGTGLGLSVSYFIIVENHGGGLEVVSNPGHGTRFIIRLPLPAQFELQAS